jgi:ABC-type transport system involved in cytochrome c biogenesis permease subunit
MTAVASLQAPTPHWENNSARGAWLIVHIVLVLLGYAALVLTALASVFYLIQERQLKRKKTIRLLERLPPLGTLDNMISKSLGFGFVLLTVGVVTGATWSYIESGPNWLGTRASLSPQSLAVCLLMVFLRVTAVARAQSGSDGRHCGRVLASVGPCIT